MDEKKKWFREEIEKYHTKLNSSDLIDETYYRRNHINYELICYINHIVACYYSNNFETMALFYLRSKKILDSHRGNAIEQKYRRIIDDYLSVIYKFLNTKDAVGFSNVISILMNK